MSSFYIAADILSRSSFGANCVGFTNIETIVTSEYSFDFFINEIWPS